MELKLQCFPGKFRLLFLFCLLSAMNYAQTIGIPTVSTASGPISVTFTVTNGLGMTNYFDENTQYTVYLSNAAGNNFIPVYTFSAGMFPASANLASATISRTVPIPLGTPIGPGYKIAVSSTLPASLGINGGNASSAFALSDSFTEPANLNGFIKCSSPSITYYVITITNTGNLTDSYNLTKIQTIYPLDSQFYSLTGSVISATPQLDPGESFTFMMRFDTPNGTPPDNWNTTVVTATSVHYPTVIQQTNISTYIYCGNNKNLPDSPDLKVVKTASTASAAVGDFIDYTITVTNLSTKNAANPVIKDFLPANAELISYNKAPGETRNVLFTYDAAANTLNALIQSTLTSATLPLTIMVRVKTYCQSVPSVYNSAEVYTVSGDSNSQNDTSSATTTVSYNVAGSNIGQWTGAYNSDWFDCRNWSGGVVPTNNIDVVIPVATPNANIDLLSTKAPDDKTARAHHFLIESGATVSMTNAGLFNLAGNWSSNGGFNRGDGTVTFMGSGNGIYQTIYDSTQKTEFHNLTINTSNSAKGLSAPDGFGLFVYNTLNLASGDIRLNGKAQLIQTKVGVTGNPSSGTGKLYVDQKGQSNKFSYNYWSSPVGVNNAYTVGSVLKDGTDPSNPLAINWIGGYNGMPTTPISLCTYWINKYQNQSGNYAGWSNLGQNGIVSAGQGFTLKGSGALTPLQNYTFVGKPNDGYFTSVVSANNMNLSGNPYPSALDAYAFIDDNSTTITGTLYFWEQFSTNSSHITAQYEGGYATLTKTGATPPAAPAGVSNAGSSNRIPGRYIPIGQGFLLFGSNSGGMITFRNSQRAFVKENDPGSNPMFRNSENTAKETTKKLRLGFTSSTTEIKRQLLFGFMGSGATTGFDKGYDAIQIDTQESDMYFTLIGQKLVIQANGLYDQAAVIPVGITLKDAGTVTINLDDVQNFEESQNIYLFDALTQQYHDLRQSSFSAYLQEGGWDNRFSLRFANDVSRLDTNDAGLLSVVYGAQLLQIDNPREIDIKSVMLYDLVGQQIATWTINSPNSQVSIPVKDITPGIYIARIISEGKMVSRKVLIGL